MVAAKFYTNHHQMINDIYNFDYQFLNAEPERKNNQNNIIPQEEIKLMKFKKWNKWWELCVPNSKYGRQENLESHFKIRCSNRKELNR
jgi:hypothetical protein